MALGTEAAGLLAQIRGGTAATARPARGGVPMQVLREVYAEAGDEPEVQRFLAGCADTPSRILEELSGRCESVGVLALLAENPRTPKSVLLHLARHERADVREAVASGKGISPQVALALCEDPDFRVRLALAENAAVTPRVQIRLSEDEVPFVRASLLRQPRLDEEIQLALSDDRDLTVQAKALLTPRLNESCLLRWADGDESLSQRLLLLRSQLPEKVLESLLFSGDEEVQCRAMERKRLTEDEQLGLARHGGAEVRRRVASLPGVSALVQVQLAGDAEASVRLALASNPSVSAEAVSRLLAEPSEETDLALAGNERVPLASLSPALSRRGATLLRHASLRPALDDEDRAFLAEHGDDGVLYQLSCRGVSLRGCPSETLARLSRHGLPSVRTLAARASGLTIALMAELSRDASPQVRLALAENAETLPSFLEALAEDDDAAVAGRARHALSKARAAAIDLSADEASADGEPEPAHEDVGVAAEPGGAPAAGDASSGDAGPDGLLGRFRAMFGRRRQP